MNKHHDFLVSLLAGIGDSFDVIGSIETCLNYITYVGILNLGYGYKSCSRKRQQTSWYSVYLLIGGTAICNDLIIKDGHSDSLVN